MFYVGKGTGRRAWSNKSRNSRWHATVAKHGIQVEIAARWASEEEAFEHEKLLVSCMREIGMPLSNMTEGGEGFSGGRHSNEYRERLRVEMKDPDRQRRMAEASRGRKLSSEHVAKMRARTISPEQRAKIAATHTGMKRSEAAKEAMRIAATGRKQSPETIAKRKATIAARKAAA